jgi:hypothetical protein
LNKHVFFRLRACEKPEKKRAYPKLAFNYTGGLRYLQKKLTISCEDVKMLEFVNPLSKAVGAIRAALNLVGAGWGAVWTALGVIASPIIYLKYKGAVEGSEDYKNKLAALESWGFSSNFVKAFRHAGSAAAHFIGVLTIPRFGNNLAAKFGTAKPIQTLKSKIDHDAKIKTDIKNLLKCLNLVSDDRFTAESFLNQTDLKDYFALSDKPEKRNKKNEKGEEIQENGKPVEEEYIPRQEKFKECELAYKDFETYEKLSYKRKQFEKIVDQEKEKLESEIKKEEKVIEEKTKNNQDCKVEEARLEKLEVFKDFLKDPLKFEDLSFSLNYHEIKSRGETMGEMKDGVQQYIKDVNATVETKQKGKEYADFLRPIVDRLASFKRTAKEDELAEEAKAKVYVKYNNGKYTASVSIAVFRLN